MAKNKYWSFFYGESIKKTKSSLKKGIKVLEERLKHQNNEVKDAFDLWQSPGYGKRYAVRMAKERDFTRKMLEGYKMALKKRK